MEIWHNGQPASKAARLIQSADDFADFLDHAAEGDPDLDRETNIQLDRETNTTPPVRHQANRRIHEFFYVRHPQLCYDCGVDTVRIKEYYMIQFELWETAIPADIQHRELCLGCLETRLGRQLVSTDFIEAPVNYTKDKSERLLNRLGPWFRDFDNWGLKDYKGKSLSELSDRIDGKIIRTPLA